MISLDDLGIHSESHKALKLTDAITGSSMGTVKDGMHIQLPGQGTKVIIGEIVDG